MTMDNIHRKKCMHQLEEAKLQKEIDDELMLNRSFKGKHFFRSNLNHPSKSLILNSITIDNRTS